MALMYVGYLVLVWYTFWLLMVTITWYKYDVHPAVLKLWRRGKFQLRRLRMRLCT